MNVGFCSWHYEMQKWKKDLEQHSLSSHLLDQLQSHMSGIVEDVQVIEEDLYLASSSCSDSDSDFSFS